MGSDTLNTGEKASERYVDDEGFVRKEINNMGTLLWILVVIANIGIRFLPEDFALLALIAWPISAYLLLIGIQISSSHDINTWKGTPHVKLWIFLSNMISGLLGLIVYDLLKRRERGYLKRAFRSAKMLPRSKI